MTFPGSTFDTGWRARIDGAIAAVAVRAGDAPAIAVATDEGDCWWITPHGEVRARAACGVDVPTDLSIHPTRDAVAVSGARGYASWEIGSEPVRHSTAWSSAVVHSPEGILAAASGRQVAIHAAQGQPSYRSGDAPSTVTAIAWTPQGDRVAASAYGGVYVYDGRQPDPVRTHPYAGSHLAVAVNPQGRWVCSGNQDASVHIWRTADNDELEMAGFPEKVTRMAFDDTGRWFANNGAPELTVWDFVGKGPRGRRPRLLSGHSSVIDLAWRPGADGVLATVGTEGSTRVWRITNGGAGKPRKANEVLPGGDALAVRWLDPSHVVVARANGVVDLLPWTTR